MLEVMMPGYFTESQCKAIKEKLEGKTFYKFQISWGNCAGNCTLIVRSAINKESNYDIPYTNGDLRDMFISYCISELAKI